MDLHFQCRALYRQYFRQIQRLPHIYLHQFYKLKARDGVKAILRANAPSVRDNRLQRLTQDIRRMGLANQGNRKAFHRVLDVAYGRKGKLRRELLEPFLPSPEEEKPPRTISFLERSRPPAYTPALKALLASEYSRKTKALKLSYLDDPPKLPLRANPDSPEARTFGRLSKRRDVNIRWRHFTKEVSKVLPPLEVENRLAEDHLQHLVSVRQGGMQGSNVMKDIEATVGSLYMPPPLTRRERKVTQSAIPSSAVQVSRHPSRWVRRRYRQILGKLPVMVFHPRDKNISPSAYTLGLSPLAFPQYQRSILHMPQADDVVQAWNAQKNIQEKLKVNVHREGEQGSKRRSSNAIKYMPNST